MRGGGKLAHRGLNLRAEVPDGALSALSGACAVTGQTKPGLLE